MINRVKLDNVGHADLRVAIRHGAAFGDAVNQLLVFPTEFEQIQREYPMIFRRDDRGAWYAVALLGLDLDENLFLSEGRWTTHYVPAVQQRGPFVTEPAASDDQAPVYIDMNDPRVGLDDGEPLFLRHGGSAPYLEHVTRVLGALRRGHAAAAPTYAALEEHGLFKPVTLDIAIDEGLSYQIADVYSIDADRLAALKGPALEVLHRSGILRGAIMAASSAGNIARLIELKRGKTRP